MTKINPSALKKLREAKGWTQEELAERTKGDGRPKIDKQTISRLERGDRAKTRWRTIEQLAKALSVDPAILTGESPVPEFEHETSRHDTRSQFNVRVATGPRNAFSLVAERYRVEPSQIVELAPFLFLCAAEESLRQRRERAKAFREKLDELEDLGGQLAHLNPQIAVFQYQEDSIGTEHESIDERDLFGSSIDLALAGLSPGFDQDTENPFAMYLRKLGEQFGETAKFERWTGSWAPEYRVCPDEAAELVGGDRDRAEEILAGQVALAEMPKDIRRPEMTRERADWVRLKGEEYRKERKRLLDEELDAILMGSSGDD